jgi:hypothetical protein
MPPATEQELMSQGQQWHMEREPMSQGQQWHMGRQPMSQWPQEMTEQWPLAPEPTPDESKLPKSTLPVSKPAPEFQLPGPKVITPKLAWIDWPLIAPCRWGQPLREFMQIVPMSITSRAQHKVTLEIERRV